MACAEPPPLPSPPEDSGFQRYCERGRLRERPRYVPPKPPGEPISGRLLAPWFPLRRDESTAAQPKAPPQPATRGSSKVANGGPTLLAHPTMDEVASGASEPLEKQLMSAALDLASSVGFALKVPPPGKSRAGRSQSAAGPLGARMRQPQRQPPRPPPAPRPIHGVHSGVWAGPKSAPSFKPAVNAAGDYPEPPMVLQIEEVTLPSEYMDPRRNLPEYDDDDDGVPLDFESPRSMEHVSGLPVADGIIGDAPDFGDEPDTVRSTARDRVPAWQVKGLSGIHLPPVPPPPASSQGIQFDQFGLPVAKSSPVARPPPSQGIEFDEFGLPVARPPPSQGIAFDQFGLPVARPPPSQGIQFDEFGLPVAPSGGPVMNMQMEMDMAMEWQGLEHALARSAAAAKSAAAHRTGAQEQPQQRQATGAPSHPAAEEERPRIPPSKSGASQVVRAASPGKKEQRGAQHKSSGSKAGAERSTRRSRKAAQAEPPRGDPGGASELRSPGAPQGAELAATSALSGSTDGAAASLQRQFGPQSRRGGASQDQLKVLEHNAHAARCFATLAKHEEVLCEEWAVFYHVYSYAALIYELQAAVAAVLYNFPSSQSSLPRILVSDFEKLPDAPSLIEAFRTKFSKDRKDHHPEYRAVALSTMCSLVALGPEVSTPTAFLAGFSQEDLSFTDALMKSLASCYIPPARIKQLADDIVALSEQYGLDVSKYGGKACATQQAGHMLQIFVHRSCVDEVAYAAHPYGEVDPERHLISEWLNGDTPMSYGQARIVANPRVFTDSDRVRMFTVSADPTFHGNRTKFQASLVRLIQEVLDTPALRHEAIEGIAGGVRPDWVVKQETQKISRAADASHAQSNSVGISTNLKSFSHWLRHR